MWSTTVAPSGLAFVKREGSAWTGDLLVATLAGNSLRRLTVSGDPRDRRVTSRYGRLRAVVEAPDGSFWVTTSNRDGRGSRVLRRPHPPRHPPRS